MKADKYASFARLAKCERAGTDYRIQTRPTRSDTLIIAPHGGGIERGTSELAAAVADDDLSLYVFEGTKKQGNRDLHITSSRFDEPSCLAMLRDAVRVVTLHGEDRDRDVLFLGGLDTATRQRLQASLERRGFTVLPPDKPHLKGVDPKNICNRCRSGAGVQIEMAKGLRRTLFESLTAVGCQSRTSRFKTFVLAVREGIGAEPAP